MDTKFPLSADFCFFLGNNHLDIEKIHKVVETMPYMRRNRGQAPSWFGRRLLLEETLSRLN
ncbi:hypothetical protein [uncultured Roseobacter sp.]|uniref:hypothetical protein n=1 Tax=uncultured Roseobacter sp. TaxID=114847 RepID=UPI002616E810|nr:hypothetical protein [uncultured Roseobacter sp.]